MLILARRNSESILIGDEVEVTILKVHGNHVQLGINAPRSVSVHRREVYDRIKKKINRAPFLANKKRP